MNDKNFSVQGNRNTIVSSKIVLFLNWNTLCIKVMVADRQTAVLSSDGRGRFLSVSVIMAWMHSICSEGMETSLRSGVIVFHKK